MKRTLWRSVRRAHAGAAFTGEGAAVFPGRYNTAGVRAVYLADCPAGCALELLANYAAPEAVATHVLFEVEVTARLVDLREPRMLRRYRVTLEALRDPLDYSAPRGVGTRLVRERRAGAIVPAATVAEAFTVVIYPGTWDRFVVRGTVPLALDDRLLRLGGTAPSDRS